jgi:hypothetical protein
MGFPLQDNDDDWDWTWSSRRVLPRREAKEQLIFLAPALRKGRPKSAFFGRNRPACSVFTNWMNQ